MSGAKGFNVIVKVRINVSSSPTLVEYTSLQFHPVFQRSATRIGIYSVILIP